LEEKHVNRNRLIALMIGAIMSAAVLSAQQKSTSSGSGTAPADASKAVTYVGCLVPGSGTDAYMLTNAKEKSAKGKPPHVTFKLAPSGKVKLEPHVTHEVAVTGTFADTPAPSSPTAAGEVVRTFSVTRVTSQATSCG
jgi:hypothetical protein